MGRLLWLLPVVCIVQGGIFTSDPIGVDDAFKTVLIALKDVAIGEIGEHCYASTASGCASEMMGILNVVKAEINNLQIPLSAEFLVAKAGIDSAQLHPSVVDCVTANVKRLQSSIFLSGLVFEKVIDFTVWVRIFNHSTLTLDKYVQNMHRGGASDCQILIWWKNVFSQMASLVKGGEPVPLRELGLHRLKSSLEGQSAGVSYMVIPNPDALLAILDFEAGVIERRSTLAEISNSPSLLHNGGSTFDAELIEYLAEILDDSLNGGPISSDAQLSPANQLRTPMLPLSPECFENPLPPLFDELDLLDDSGVIALIPHSGASPRELVLFALEQMALGYWGFMADPLYKDTNSAVFRFLQMDLLPRLIMPKNVFSLLMEFHEKEEMLGTIDSLEPIAVRLADRIRTERQLEIPYTVPRIVHWYYEHMWFERNLVDSFDSVYLNGRKTKYVAPTGERLRKWIDLERDRVVLLDDAGIDKPSSVVVSLFDFSPEETLTEQPRPRRPPVATQKLQIPGLNNPGNPVIPMARALKPLSPIKNVGNFDSVTRLPQRGNQNPSSNRTVPTSVRPQSSTPASKKSKKRKIDQVEEVALPTPTNRPNLDIEQYREEFWSELQAFTALSALTRSPPAEALHCIRKYIWRITRESTMPRLLELLIIDPFDFMQHYCGISRVDNDGDPTSSLILEKVYHLPRAAPIPGLLTHHWLHHYQRQFFVTPMVFRLLSLGFESRTSSSKLQDLLLKNEEVDIPFFALQWYYAVFLGERNFEESSLIEYANRVYPTAAKIHLLARLIMKDL